MHKSIPVCLAITLLAGVGVSFAGDSTIAPLKLKETAPNVCFVNVGAAIPARDFAEAVSNACCLQLHVNYQTADLAESGGFMNLVTTRRVQMQTFGEHVKLVVYIVSSDELPGILSMPGQCALINIRRMRLDNPSDAVYQKRLTKIAMKGLALACGVSGNNDPRCVMFWKSFSVGGIDATSASYGPQSFFMLQELLTDYGTREIFRPFL